MGGKVVMAEIPTGLDDGLDEKTESNAWVLALELDVARQIMAPKESVSSSPNL